MSEKGWIKLHRKVVDCEIWKTPTKFDERSAWVDILLMANHSKQTIKLSNGQKITLLPGQFYTSKPHLAIRWQWSIKKVRCFLEKLKRLGMVTTEVTTKGTTVTVKKWAFYQTQGPTEGQTEAPRTRSKEEEPALAERPATKEGVSEALTDENEWVDANEYLRIQQ